MRDKNGRMTKPIAGAKDPARTRDAVSHEDRRDMGGRFTTPGGEIKSKAAGKRLR